MKLTMNGLKDKAVWEKAGIDVPDYDIQGLYNKTKADPRWVHFGIGNIFRIFIGSIADKLIRDKKLDTGITCVESFDYEIVDKIYKPYDNLELSVILNEDGTCEKRVLAPFGEVLKADYTDGQEWNRLKEVFRARTLQIVSFTITEKGYALTGLDGTYTKGVLSDINDGPERCRGAIAVVASMLYERYQSNAAPISLVSMDNCSHNGERLMKAVFTICDEWLRKGYVDEGFRSYIHDSDKVAFPWTMIDKITPRPEDRIAAILTEDGVEGMSPIITSKKTFIAPFGNAEKEQYLVVEDTFPNGRPQLEPGGVYMTDRGTVNKAERMKVNTCLNPIHTGLCTYDCMLGYELFADGMKDPLIAELARQIGYVEGLPVVEDPGILSPKTFLDEVIHERVSNPYLGDTSQRIAVDISQMVGIRFGETIKSYVKRDGTARKLTAIPLAIAGWIRYLLEMDDKGQHFDLAPDPMIPELQKTLAGLKFGDPSSVANRLRPLLSNENIFGSNLYDDGLGEKIEEMVSEEIEGPGAVRRTLTKYLFENTVPETMTQQVMVKPGEIVFREISVPVPEPYQVLVKIKRIGICGSDVHVYHGTHPYTGYPVTQGHEVSGQIVQKGSDSKKFEIGQRVVIEPQVFCGHCYPCLHGKYNLCEDLKVMGFQTTGTASEYFAVDESKCTSIPDNMTYDEGAMIEPLAVAIHAAKRISVVGKKIVVLGCGPIGILLCQSLKAFGASEVLATDVSDYRLRIAKTVGADYIVNTKVQDFGEALIKCFGADKADIAYDCAGNDDSINSAIRNARKGSTIILVAVFGKLANVDLAKLNDSELDLNTTMMYRHEDYEDAIHLVSNGKIRLKPLMSVHFSFRDYLKAYQYIDANRETTMKVLIDVDPDSSLKKTDDNSGQA